MSIRILRQALNSRIVRRTLTNNTGRSSIGGLINPEEENVATKIFKFIGNSLLGGVNWIINRIKSIDFSFQNLFSLLVSGISFVTNFNWNISDESLDSTVESLNSNFYSQLGETIGTSLGYLVCGIVPSAGIAVFNNALALELLYRVGPEAIDQITDSMFDLVRVTYQNLKTRFIYEQFKNTRKTIKNYYQDPNSPQSKMAKKLFGPNFHKAVNKWGENGAEPWIISEKIEDLVDSIPDKRLRTVTEELLPAFGDACIDAGYIVTGGIDDWIAKRRLEESRQEEVNPETTIELIPDRDNPEESYLIHASENNIIQTLPLQFAQLQAIENRNVGNILLDDEINLNRRKPFQKGITIKVLLSNQKRLYRPGDKRVVVTVQNVNRQKLDFERIIRAFGGEEGYFFGKYLLKVTLDDGQDLKMWHNSIKTGYQILERLADLADAEIIKKHPPFYTENQVDVRDRKEPVKVYPVKLIITYKSVSIVERYQRKNDPNLKPFHEESFILFQGKPDNWNQRLAKLFKTNPT